MPSSDLEPHEDGSAQGNRKGRQALSNVRRELSEEELSSPAVQRMLLDELDRLETEAGELKEFKDRFYSADKDAAVLGERLRASWRETAASPSVRRCSGSRHRFGHSSRSGGSW